MRVALPKLYGVRSQWGLLALKWIPVLALCTSQMNRLWIKSNSFCFFFFVFFFSINQICPNTCPQVGILTNCLVPGVENFNFFDENAKFPPFPSVHYMFLIVSLHNHSEYISIDKVISCLTIWTQPLISILL